jgi:hypothetical protein
VANSRPPQAVGLDQRQQFYRYHRVLSRANWSSGEASRVLSELLVGAFMPKDRRLWGSTRPWSVARERRSPTVGLAVPLRPPGLLRAVRHNRAGQTPQVAHRVGLADALVVRTSRRQSKTQEAAWIPVTVSGWFVPWLRTHGGDRLKYRHLVQHGLARRARAVGHDP